MPHVNGESQPSVSAFEKPYTSRKSAADTSTVPGRSSFGRGPVRSACGTNTAAPTTAIAAMTTLM